MSIKFIAEVSSNHSKNLKRSLDFIDTAAEIGCDSVKFQLFRVKQLFSYEVLARSKKLRNREQWELPLDFLPILSERCKKKSIQLVDNTQDEINDLCSEVMQRLESNYHQTKDQINLQKKFNEICLNFISLEKNIKRYPIVGTKFLAKYSDLII